MKQQIINFIELSTTNDNIWVNINSLYRHFLNIQSIDILEIEKNLVIMLNTDQLRSKEDENNLYLTTTNLVNSKLNEVKKSALEEMKDEMEKYVKDEEYEKAADIRDILKEYE